MPAIHAGMTNSAFSFPMGESKIMEHFAAYVVVGRSFKWAPVRLKRSLQFRILTLRGDYAHRNNFPRGLVTFCALLRHLATKSSHGVPSTRNASRQNPVVSRPSR